MNELTVKVEQTQGLVSANFEELKRKLFVEMDSYKGIIYTDETVAIGKKDVAMLRKVIKKIDESRIEVKKKQMIPYEKFARQAKELIEIITNAIDPLVVQLDEFEEDRKTSKKKWISGCFDSYAKDISKYTTLDDIYETKMLNIGTTLIYIQEVITNHCEVVKAEIQAIKDIESEFTEKALTKYAGNKSLADALLTITTLEKQKREILAEQEKIERAKKEFEEHKRILKAQKEQLERERAEQRKISDAIEKAKAEERKKLESELAVKYAKEESARIAREKIEREEFEKSEKIRIELETKERELLKEDERKLADKIAKEKAENQLFKILITGLCETELEIVIEFLKESNHKYQVRKE